MVAPLLVVAALVVAVPAAADLRPIDRRAGEIELPRVRTGTVAVPKGHARGRITVVVRLGQPPLAQWTGRESDIAGVSLLFDDEVIVRRRALRRPVAPLRKART